MIWASQFVGERGELIWSSDDPGSFPVPGPVIVKKATGSVYFPDAVMSDAASSGRALTITMQTAGPIRLCSVYDPRCLMRTPANDEISFLVETNFVEVDTGRGLARFFVGLAVKHKADTANRDFCTGLFFSRTSI